MNSETLSKNIFQIIGLILGFIVGKYFGIIGLIGVAIGGFVSQVILYLIITKLFKTDALKATLFSIGIAAAISFLGMYDDYNFTEKYIMTNLVRIYMSYLIFTYYKSKINENGNTQSIQTSTNEIYNEESVRKTFAETNNSKKEIETVKYDQPEIEKYSYLLSADNKINIDYIYKKSIESYEHDILKILELLLAHGVLNIDSKIIYLSKLKTYVDEKDNIELKNLHNMLIDLNIDKFNNNVNNLQKNSTQPIKVNPVNIDTKNSTEEKLDEIMKLREKGLISDEEFKEFKNKIITKLIES